MLGGLLLILLAPAPAWADEGEGDEEAALRLAELAATTQRILLNGPADEHGRRVSRHYLWSNERRHDLFFDDIRGLGRGYLGVGADQNYTLAAVACADVVYLIDIDAAVVNLHRLYGAVLAAAPTAEQFLSLLSGRRDGELRAAVAARLPEPKDRAAALQIYEEFGPLLYSQLRRTQRHRQNGVPVSWLGDKTLYERIRTLALAGRLVARVGDLAGSRTMLEVAQAARAAGVPMRVLYLSNAESWFSHYSSHLLRNLRALPLDQRSVVLRTVKSRVLRYPAGDAWHFSVQGASDFVEKLALRRYRVVDGMLADLIAPGGLQPGCPRGLSRIAPGIPDPPRPIVEGLITRPQPRQQPVSTGNM